MGQRRTGGVLMLRLSNAKVVARLALAGVLAAAAGTSPADAATAIRDAEIEGTLHRIADPIFGAAQLDVDSIRIIVISDDKLNAFVAGGQNLFLNTGLLIRSETPDQLAGVIAHETGHIAGGHLSRAVGAQNNALVTTLLGAALGAAAAFAGAPQVGSALIVGGTAAAQGSLLSFSRTQESAADQAAVRFLDALHRSPEGLLEFFQILQGQNLRISTDGNVFLRTHPLTQDRIDALESKIATSRWKDARPDPSLVEAHARMVAKLDGFLAAPADVLRRRAGDALVDRYARSVALFRSGDSKRSVQLIDGLLAERPDDPWFQELKGQVLFEGGQIAQAEAPYRAALRLRPDAPLLRLGLARTLMEQGDGGAAAAKAGGDAKLKEAVALLKETVRLEPENGGAWHFLGVAQGQLGQEGEASLSLAESAVLAHNKRDAQLYLARVNGIVRPGDPAWIRAQDLGRAVADMEEPRPDGPPGRRGF